MRPKPRYQPGDKIGGRYQVHQALMGGMGEVYLCLDLEETLPYALKTFQQRYLTNTKLRAAFEHEVATWVALEKHPNIVRCHYMEIIDNQPFMFLEWIVGQEDRGTDLRGWLRRGPPGLRTALDFVIDVCRGLDHAQGIQPGIVHRDLKPENILVAQGPLAKITDFGLAQIARTAELEIEESEARPEGRQGLRGLDGIVGTRYYMAPELWLEETVDVRTDIYALGCILYEMLTGEILFMARRPSEFRDLHLKMEIPKLARSRGLPQALDTLLAGCLAKQREQRFSLTDLLARLEGLYKEAYAAAPRPVSRSPFSAIDFNNRAATYVHLQQYEAAMADATQAIEMAPGFVQAYVNRGSVHADLQQYQAALADYGRAIELDPNFAPAYVNRGSIYDDLQQPQKSLADYERAIELDPNLVQAYSNRGNAYRALRQYEKALADYRQAIKLDPDFVLAYYNRATTWDLLQQPEAAQADYSRVIELDPNDALAYHHRGLVRVDLGQYEAAVADYSRTIELNPRFALVYFHRSLVYRTLQQHKLALVDLDRAIELDPDSAPFYANRGITYCDLQQYEKAIADCDRAIQLNPRNADAYNGRGYTYHHLGRMDDALRDYEQAIKLNPSYADAYYNRGTVHYARQHYEDALSDFDQTIKLKPYLEKAYNNRGAAHRKLGHYDAALRDYEKAAELDPNDSFPPFNVGVVILMDFGRAEEAIPHFVKAQKLGHPHAAQVLSDIRQQMAPQAQGRPEPTRQDDAATAQKPQLAPQQFLDRFSKDVFAMSEDGTTLIVQHNIGHKMVAENLQSAIAVFDTLFATVQRSGEVGKPNMLNFMTLFLGEMLHKATGDESYATKVRYLNKKGKSF